MSSENSLTKSTFPILIICALALCIASCTEDNRGSQEAGAHLNITIVGDGVPPVDQNNRRPFPINRAQGEAMYRGAVAALENSPRLDGLSTIVDITGFDDRGSPEFAGEIANSIRADPRVLAVIGHATSQTTGQAAWIYDKVGIPLVMPIATSPEVMFQPETNEIGTKRLRRVFRLPPSDDKGQAPSVAHLVRRLGLTRVYFLRDGTPGTERYSVPLSQAVEPYIAPLVVNRLTEVAREETNFTELARSIQAQSVEGVVFAGYGSTALDLLDALRTEYADVSLEYRPVIILTDGCYISDLNTQGFRVYLTFPHIETPRDADQEDIKILSQTSKSDSPISYEGFGYDAMLIIGTAIKRCQERGEVSRTCISEVLGSGMPFVGTSGVYEFEEGENKLAQYDILLAGTNQDGELSWTINEVVTAVRLQEIRAGGR